MTLTVKKAAQTTQAAKPVSKASAKPVAKAKQKVLTETQMLVNEYAHLAHQYEQQEIGAMVKRMDELKKRLQSIANETSPGDTVTLAGTEGTVTFSPCREETVITDRDKMIKALTPKVFVEIGKVNLGDIKKYLSEGEIQAFSEKQYGARTLKAFTYAED